MIQKMAGSLALFASVEKSDSAIKDQWQVLFSRFIGYPSLPSTCPFLVPLPNNRRRRPTSGTWISSLSPTACVRLLHYRSSSDAILSVSLGDNILEEHYVSKLHFTWPQVTCLSGYPPRGSRAAFVSYKDSVGEIQKFAFRFTLITEAERFINALKDILKDSTEIAPLNSDFQSEISLQYVFLSPSRASEEESTVTTPLLSNSNILPFTNEVGEESRTAETAPSHQSEGIVTACSPNSASFLTNCNEMKLNSETEEVSCTEETAPDHNHENISTALPPSFTSFLTNCYSEVKQAPAQPSSSEDVDLKSQIARYMKDSSFQELLIEVDKVISEFGDDILL